MKMRKQLIFKTQIFKALVHDDDGNPRTSRPLSALSSVPFSLVGAWAGCHGATCQAKRSIPQISIVRSHRQVLLHL